MGKYVVRLENFEGPFELLFHLLQKEKINIYDIPISKITNQYIGYIEEAKEMDLEIASEFLVMASTLIQIKSKMLLPKMKDEKEEEDPREELVNRLLEYKIYKEVADALREMEREAQKSFARNKQENIYKKDVSIVLDVSLDKLIQSFKDVLKRADVREKVKETTMFEHQIKKETFTIEDRIDNIKTFLNRKREVVFMELFKDDSTKNEVVTTFMAMLELLKLKFAKVSQEEPFADIYIYRV